MLRIVLGVTMVVFGVVGFLPVLGFWMLPLGLAILAIDFPPVRRFRRRGTGCLGNWLHRRWAGSAARLGNRSRRPGRKA